MRVIPKMLVIFALIVKMGAINQHEIDLMLTSNYEGTWSFVSSDQIRGNSPFSKFTVDQGIALIYFTDMGRGTNQIEGLTLEILAPQYYDQLLVKLMIDLSLTKKSDKLEWIGEAQASYEIYDQTYKMGQGKQNYNYTIDSRDIVISNDIEKFTIQIAYHTLIISPEITLIFTLFSLAIYFIIGPRKQVEEDTTIRHQILPIILSLTMLLLVSIVEFIIGFNSLFGSMNPEAFFLVPGYFNLSSASKMFKSNLSIIFRKKKLIILSWVSVILYLWLLLYFRHSYIFMIINSFIFIPQIIYHAIKGQKVVMDYRYIVLCLSNQAYIVYFKVCPKNMFRQSPNSLLGYCILGILFVQVLLVIGQIYISPRFFIPWFFLPKKFDYFNESEIKKIGLKYNSQCHICLEEIMLSKRKKNKLMVTPCKHLFHSKCLQQWMAVKMACPVDRTKLPPL